MKNALSCGCLAAALLLAGACTAGSVALLAVAFDPPAVVAPDADPAPDVQPETPAPVPAPDVVPTPAPKPKPDCPDCPKPNPRRPWGPRENQPVGLVGPASSSLLPAQPRRPRPHDGGGLVHDGPTHDGQEVQIDLPADILKNNIAWPTQMHGYCVFRSANYCGLYNNIPQLIDLPEQMKAARIEGGGWPQKVDEVMAKFAPGVRYVQVQNGDWELVKLALKTGRCVCITYGSAHMVNLVKLEGGVGCFRDNNLVGPNELIWGSEEAIKRQAGGSKFWAYFFLAGRPPAPPRAPGVAPRTAGADLLVSTLQPPRLSGRYEWRGVTGGIRSQWSLWRDGRQVGTYTAMDDSYSEYLGADRWGRKWRRPPVALPPAAMECLERQAQGGVRTERLRGDAPRYSVCGRDVSAADVRAMLEDDSAKLSLTAIGDPAETARVAADLDRPEFAGFKSRVVFQQYTRDNWAVSPARYGFDTTGHPTIYLETPDGTPLWHVRSYEGPSTLTTLRKKDPNYKPDADPGIRPQPAPSVPAVPATPDVAAGDGAAWLVLAGGLLLMGCVVVGIGLFCVVEVAIPDPLIP